MRKEIKKKIQFRVFNTIEKEFLILRYYNLLQVQIYIQEPNIDH